VISWFQNVLSKRNLHRYSKAKVHVPRLDGATVGALATRTPHRPLPIGLSIGRVVSVDVNAGTLTLAGADLVDGTPVIDLKPYVPFCDSIPTAFAPEWVGREVGGCTS
jgi:tRNA (Thr-GGU) A37 N-methylase